MAKKKALKPPKPRIKTWFIYLIRCESGALYTGISTDVERRFKQHACGKGAKFFRANKPECIVWTEVQPEKGTALKREYEIKRWSHEQKLALMNSKS